MAVVVSEKLRCPECDGFFEEAGGPVYECSRCGGTQVDERRCYSCNIFMAKLADESCPECEAAIEEALESVTVFEAEDGTEHESEQEALDWMAAAPERAARAAEVKAQIDAEIEKRKQEAAERGERLAPKVEALIAGLTERWGPWAVSIGPEFGPGTQPSARMRDLIETLRWHHENLVRYELGSLTVPLPLMVLVALVAPDERWAAGIDYMGVDREVREALESEARAVVVERIPALERWASYLTLGGSVYVDLEVGLDILAEALEISRETGSVGRA